MRFRVSSLLKYVLKNIPLILVAGVVVAWMLQLSVHPLFVHLDGLDTTLFEYVMYDNCDSLESSNNADLWRKYCQYGRQSHDPRQLLAHWLYKWNRAGKIESPVSFNWPDFLQLSRHITDCATIFAELHLPTSDISKYCVDDKLSGTAIITTALNFTSSAFNYRAIGEKYLINAPIPSQIAFLVGNNQSVFVPTIEGSSPLHSHHSLVHLPTEINNFRNQIKHLFKLSVPDSNEPVVVQSSINPILSRDEFMYNESLLFLKLQPYENFHDGNLVEAYNSFKNNFQPTKYFREPKMKHAGHFDWRFFKQLEYSQYERISHLHKLSRAWFQFSQSIGVKSWLAHGTMLGWHWNGANLPWDNDLDIQTTTDSLFKLARYYNQTLVIQLNDDSFGQYLIDVNTYIFDRNKSEGNNVIDARFIDVRTGFYIDITALSYTNSSKGVSISKKQLIEFNRLLDPEYIDHERSQTLLITDLNKKLFNTRAELFNNKEIYNCKNNHYYSYQELSPLQSTLFEGVLSYVPYDSPAILKREYPKGLYYRSFNGYNWNPKLKIWIENNVCKLDHPCTDPEQLKYSKVYEEITSIHKQNMYYKLNYLQELQSKILDPWIILGYLKVYS